MTYEKEAYEFCRAMKALANNEDRMENFECYLTYCFGAWLKRCANIPENIVAEMLNFAAINEEEN